MENDESFELCGSQLLMELATDNYLSDNELQQDSYLTIHANVEPHTMNMIGKTTFIIYYLMIRGGIEERFHYIDIISPDLYARKSIFDQCKSSIEKKDSSYLWLKCDTNKSLYIQNKLTKRKCRIRFSNLGEESSFRGIQLGLTILHDFYEKDMIKLCDHQYRYTGPGGKIILLVKTFTGESLAKVNAMFDKYVRSCIDHDTNGRIFLVKLSSRVGNELWYYPYLGHQHINV